MNNTISAFDILALSSIRNNVEQFMRHVATTYASDLTGGERLLDIAPQDHTGASPFFNKEIRIETLDIDPNSGATYIADLSNCAKAVGIDRFQFIACTEVLEHTRQPFDAVDNIFKMLKPGGLAFISTPYNFRIHGP